MRNHSDGLPISDATITRASSSPNVSPQCSQIGSYSPLMVTCLISVTILPLLLPTTDASFRFAVGPDLLVVNVAVLVHPKERTVASAWSVFVSAPMANRKVVVPLADANDHVCKFGVRFAYQMGHGSSLFFG